MNESCIFIALLSIIGVIGVFLNILVIMAVRQNRKLSTSINYLLVWICVSSIMEATRGIAVKIFLLSRFLLSKALIKYFHFQLELCQEHLTIPT